LVFARSAHRTRRLAAGAAGAAAVLGASCGALLASRQPLGGLALLVGFLVALAALVRAAVRLRRWPAGRLGFFRDRLILVQPRTELHAPWEDLITATLADLGDSAVGRWPEVALTERLTLRLSHRRISFRPASFGLDPESCRDLVLRLRDDPALRQRLPEFSSALDLNRGLRTGERMRPKL
jgi:hypothetical protein